MSNKAKYYHSLIIKAIRLALKGSAYLTIAFIGIFVPKDKNQWIFLIHKSHPFGCNIRAFYEYCLQISSIKPIIICHKNDFKNISDIYKNQTDIKIVKIGQLSSLWLYLRSSICFISQGTNIPHFGKKVIDLWHGVPIKSLRNKRIEFSFNFLNYSGVDFIISNSRIDRLSMSVNTNIDFDKVWMTGLPRNDLFYQDYKLPQDLIDQESKLKKIINGRKLILYAPTFRDNEAEYDREVITRQQLTLNTNPLSPKNEDFKKIIPILKKHNAVLGVRRHYVEKQWNYPDPDFIIDCGKKEFSETQILLRNTNLLITDYSGIMIDFLLMNKPILGFCYDYDQYVVNRDFIYNFKKIFPGKISYNLNELLADLENLLVSGENEESIMARRKAFDIFHEFNDGKSSERVMEKAIKILNGK